MQETKWYQGLGRWDGFHRGCISPHPSTLSTHFVGHFAEHVPPTYDSKRPFLKSNACLTPPNVYSNGKKVKKPNVSRGPNGLTFFGDVRPPCRLRCDDSSRHSEATADPEQT